MFSRRFISFLIALGLLLLAGAGAAGNYSAQGKFPPFKETGISSKKSPLKDPERISSASVSVLQLSVHKKVTGGEALPVTLNDFAYAGAPGVKAQGLVNSHKAYLFFIYPSHHFW